MEPNCQNIFCGKCLLKWLENKNSCPLCRDSIISKELIYIGKHDLQRVGGVNYSRVNYSRVNYSRVNYSRVNYSRVNYSNDHPHQDLPNLTKINTTIKLIKNNPEGRFIIFSECDQTFSAIRTHLKVHHISFIEVKGSVNKREKNIKSFKDGNIQVIFLNSRFNGAGINLQESSDIIVYHRMCDATLNQIIGRANRIGRKDSLNVHHLELI
jgi:SNF2 family DNA or RNA helicase